VTGWVTDCETEFLSGGITGQLPPKSKVLVEKIMLPFFVEPTDLLPRLQQKATDLGDFLS
jgi:hypothetical protein